MAHLPVPARSVRTIPVGDDTEQKLLYKICGILATGVGLGGVDVIADTALHATTQGWNVIHAITDVIISSVTYNTSGVNNASTGASNLAGATIKAGDRIYGPFASVTLTSGTAELYRPAI